MCLPQSVTHSFQGREVWVFQRVSAPGRVTLTYSLQEQGGATGMTDEEAQMGRHRLPFTVGGLLVSQA